MILGKIIWFGGFNKQKNQINDYGFIHPLEDEIPDLYVHRSQIPETLQPLLESPQGPGIYVTFTIDWENLSRARAINIKLYTEIGIVKNSRIIESDSLIQSSFNYNSEEVVKPGTLVRFALRQQLESHPCSAIIRESIPQNTSNSKIINYCFTSRIFPIFLYCFSNYFQYFSLENIATACLEKFSTLKVDEQPKLLSLLVKKHPEIILNSLEIRQLLSDNCYFYFFIDNHSHIFTTAQETIIQQEVIARLKTLNPSETETCWNHSKYLQNNLKYHNFLWNLAPKNFKQKIIQEKYHSFFDLFSKFTKSKYSYSDNLSYDWKKLYDFNSNELELIKKWIKGNAGDKHDPARMISARGAEKLALKYYRSLNYSVEDISIHQITQESYTWIQGDIRLNQDELLDVKNARYATNSNTYSEFCVPKFKQNRSKDIKIVAVVSPYLNLTEIKTRKQPKYRPQQPQILGTFKASELKKIESIFSNTILKVNIGRLESQANYLPHWLFDYDEIFYHQQRQLIKQFQELPSEYIPEWEDISLFDHQNFIGFFIAAKRQLPSSWIQHFKPWVRDFINLLLNVTEQQITLPYLFLSLLSHFLAMLSATNVNYSPKAYLKILDAGNGLKHPLKIYDPLNTIENFCDTLNTLWEYRHQYKLNEFKIFKFSGKGLLQGQRSASDYPPTTIIAYCGGWTESRGKCGYLPLVIGKHQICPECHHLICPQKDCGHCNDNCSTYLSRRNLNRISGKLDKFWDLE